MSYNISANVLFTLTFDFVNMYDGLTFDSIEVALEVKSVVFLFVCLFCLLYLLCVSHLSSILPKVILAKASVANLAS